MARSRNIKPGFFLNDELAEVEPLGRILFAGLWCIADREGRLEDKPRRIKVEVLPYDDCDVNYLLNQLAERGFIVRYEHESNPYIQIINFTKHQNPHPREVASVIPAYPCLGNTQALPDKLQGNAEQQSSNADSLISDSLLSDSLISEKENFSAIIFKAWNEQDIIVHRELTETVVKAVNNAVKKYGLDNVLLAIQRYSIVYHDTNYYFSHRWTLLNFLKRKEVIPSFLDEGEKWLNYQDDKKPRKQKPDSRYYDELGDPIPGALDKTPF